MTTIAHQPTPDNFEYNHSTPFTFKWSMVPQMIWELVAPGAAFMRPFGIATGLALMYLFAFLTALEAQQHPGETVSFYLGMMVFTMMILVISFGTWRGFVAIVGWIAAVRPAFELLIWGIFDAHATERIGFYGIVAVSVLLLFWDEILDLLDATRRKRARARRVLRREMLDTLKIFKRYLKEQDRRAWWHFYPHVYVTRDEYVIALHGARHLSQLDFNMDELSRRYEVTVTRRDGISRFGNPMIDFHIPREPGHPMVEAEFTDRAFIDLRDL